MCEVECAIAPPAPASLYQCVKGSCVESPTGIPLDTCRSLCNAPVAGPIAPPDPYDKGCQAKTDCQSCLQTQVPGPVPLPGIQQNCGWCFKTNECHDSQTLSHGHCALGCTAKRFPVFDGPQCPASTCNPQRYVCKGGACVKQATKIFRYWKYS